MGETTAAPAAPVTTTTPAPPSGTTPGAPAVAAGAPSTPVEPNPRQVDFEKRLEELGALDVELKQRLRAADTVEKRYAKFKDAIEAAERGEDAAAVRALLGERYKTAAGQLIEAMATDVETPSDIPVAEQVRRTLQAERDAEAKKAAEKQVEEDRKRAEAADRERAAAVADYMGEVAGVMKADPSKFPVCAAWSKKITDEAVLAKFGDLRKATGKNPSPEEMLAAFEKDFQDEIDRTPFGRRAAPPAPKTFAERAEEVFQTAKLEQRAKSPTGKLDPATVNGKSGLEKAYDILERMEREKGSRLQF